MTLEITCINKDGGDHYDRHEAISDLGWLNESTSETGKCTRLAMVDWLEKNTSNQAYVKDTAGNKAYLKVRTSASGSKFVQTVADGRYTNNLLELPECR